VGGNRGWRKRTFLSERTSRDCLGGRASEPGKNFKQGDMRGRRPLRATKESLGEGTGAPVGESEVAPIVTRRAHEASDQEEKKNSDV